MSLLARRIRVAGLVQGVGFRPFVWRLAQELQLTGWVRNDAQGVEIFAQGAAAQLGALLRRLRDETPVLARIDAVHALDAAPDERRDFTIAASVAGPAATAIGPDVAVCPDCLDELFDPTNRRWRHGLITCTNCGPRYTVTRALPYDRAQTSLAEFALCAACATEYGAPAERRFHAETIGCPDCGPRLTLLDAQGHVILGDPISETLRLLQAGAIVAIKGLGGFHLACDARNAVAVARLRLRKNRDAKPFAVMTANAVSLAPYAIVEAAERTLLESRERPVVLLRARANTHTTLAGVAPGLLELGVMLPTTPLHFLLFHEAIGRTPGCAWLSQPQAMVLVMTSANPGGEPIVCQSNEALKRLAGMADALLDHDRDIVARCDDSVVRLQGTVAQFMRRSRGHAPAALRLARTGPSVLAFGAHLKSSVCVTRGDEAFVSPHIGDLDNAATAEFLDETVQRMLDLLAIKPDVVAHDLHPDYLSTRAAMRCAARLGVPTMAVQHHHAHIAAVCAEHAHRGPVLGLALDGVGLGLDGSLWGGELLSVDGACCERLGHLKPLPLPGGDSAAREPWRMAAAVLHAQGRHAEIAVRFQSFGGAVLADMLDRGVRCPRSSSMGRVFDAAAGLLGICTHLQYEAQAAILLEQAATRHIEVHGWPQAWALDGLIDAQGQFDVLPLLAALEGAKDVDQAAAQFHATLVALLSDWVMQALHTRDLRTLAWGGGCFHNSLLSVGLRQRLAQAPLTVLAPLRLSPGDAGLALGQAWVAINALEP